MNGFEAVQMQSNGDQVMVCAIRTDPNGFQRPFNAIRTDVNSLERHLRHLNAVCRLESHLNAIFLKLKGVELLLNAI